MSVRLRCRLVMLHMKRGMAFSSSSIIINFLLLLLLFGCFALPVFPARYEWQHDWQVINNSSLKDFQAGQGYGSFRIIAVDGVPILSDSSALGFAFLNFNSTGNYYMSVMLGVGTGDAVPIWTANRNTPVSERASVQIISGEMRLLDSQGNRVWSPLQLLVRGIELDDSGNLRLYDDQNTTLWQTFDHLTDVLMLGQKFITGSKLVGNANQSSMAEGAFITVVEASGLALYLTSMDSSTVSPQPYSISIMQNTTVKRQLSMATRQCPDYNAVFTYKGADFLLEYEANGDSPKSLPCAQPRQVHFSFINSSRSLRFLRLEHFGDLVSYGYDPGSSDWKADFSWESLVGSKTCPYPLSCGAYGICQSRGAPCKCFSKETWTYDVDYGNVCPAQSWATQDRCSSTNQQFINLLGVTYFSNNLLPPDMNSSLDNCLNLCKSNCSCAALFYDKISEGCRFVEEVLGSLDFDGTALLQYSAHLKIYNDMLPVSGGDDAHKSSATHVKVVIAVLVVVFSLVGLLSIGLWLRRRRRNRHEQMAVKSLLDALPGAPPHRFSYKDLSIATKGFSHRLGAGGFGSVYAGTLSNGKNVAVKRLEAHSSQGQKQFVAEVVSLGSISHVNIVRLCGYCVKKSYRLLVYEHIVNGSLDKWLFGERPEVLSWNARLEIALGTARGLAYLHEECREPIIHLDIKPQNILLDKDLTVKVADFGLSRLLTSKDITQVVTGVRGTPGYLAPEWLMNSIATKKCDVYSYGMVLLELLSGRRNADSCGLDNSASGWYFPQWVVSELKEGRMMHAVDEKIRCAEIMPQVERLLRVALWCIQDSPGARPMMSMVVQMLEGHNDIPDPPLVFRFSSHSQVGMNSTLSFNTITSSLEAR